MYDLYRSNLIRTHCNNACRNAYKIFVVTETTRLCRLTPNHMISFLMSYIYTCVSQRRASLFRATNIPQITLFSERCDIYIREREHIEADKGTRPRARYALACFLKHRRRALSGKKYFSIIYTLSFTYIYRVHICKQSF